MLIHHRPSKALAEIHLGLAAVTCIGLEVDDVEFQVIQGSAHAVERVLGLDHDFVEAIVQCPRLLLLGQRSEKPLASPIPPRAPNPAVQNPTTGECHGTGEALDQVGQLLVGFAGPQLVRHLERDRHDGAWVVGEGCFGHHDLVVPVLQSGHHLSGGLASGKFAKKFLDVLDLERALLQTVLSDVILHGYRLVGRGRSVIIHWRGRRNRQAAGTAAGPSPRGSGAHLQAGCDIRGIQIMPELPDVTIYVERLCARVVGQRLDRVRLGSPFVLRSVAPPLSAVEARTVRRVTRVGKRIVITVDGERSLVIHLMIAGRLRWREAKASLPKRRGLAAFDFGNGTLLFTEEGSKRRASLHVVGSAAELAAHDRGGLEPLDATLAQFREALVRENHTVKRALTDPRLFSGIGNAYSDEILHAARLSPMKLTQRMNEPEIGRLHAATSETLELWTVRLRKKVGEGFPEKVTAFHGDMAVHGRYGQPCPVCLAPVQRIVYASNEANYCARCQTGGRLLSDRSMSRLLKSDWPRSLDELEQVTAARQTDAGTDS